MGAEYVLEMKNITKRYGETTVLSDVSLSVRPGEIHALLGENGAGKSTLMNVLFGMPVIHSTGGFDGEVLIGGEKANILSPNDAMNAGIGMVHQEFMLLPGFTITENIKLNREITRPSILSKVLRLKNLENLDMPAMRQDARKALDSVGMTLDENTLVKGLPVGYMQFVEIAREIDKKGIRLLVFDEPTAVLTESEAETLLSVMKQIAKSGIAIIFITHRLDEVMAAADNITILRDGKLAATREKGKTSLVELAELMIGRKGEAVVTATPKAENKDANIALSIKNLIVDMPGEDVKGVDLDVREGEILGVGGLAGQGKIGIPNGIMASIPPPPTRSSSLAAAAPQRRGQRPEKRHGHGLRRPARRGPFARSVHRGQHRLQRHADQRRFPPQGRLHHHQGRQEGARSRQKDDPRSGHPLHLLPPGGGHALRRQPAEGVRGPGADDEPQVPLRLRADPRQSTSAPRSWCWKRWSSSTANRA